jgi:hypothetical protein
MEVMCDPHRLFLDKAEGNDGKGIGGSRESFNDNLGVLIDQESLVLSSQSVVWDEQTRVLCD